MRCVRFRPNVEGNRRADGLVTEDQGVCRRVRLTGRLARSTPRGKYRWNVRGDSLVRSIEIADAVANGIFGFEFSELLLAHEVRKLRPGSSGRVRKVTENLPGSENTARSAPSKGFVHDWTHAHIEGILADSFDRWDEGVLELLAK